MTEAQRQRALDLMKASLSQVGYTTATTIMSLERVLRITENADETGRSGGQPVAPYINTPPAPTMGAACGLGDLSGIGPAPGAGGGQRRGGGGGAAAAPAAGGAAAPAAGGGQAVAGGGQAAGGGRAGGGRAGGGGGGAPIIRDSELYYFSVFGEPSAKGKWGWRVEGHHMSFRCGVDAGKATVSTTPQFLGANPARVPDGISGAGMPVVGPHAALRKTPRAPSCVAQPTQCSSAIAAGTAWRHRHGAIEGGCANLRSFRVGDDRWAARRLAEIITAAAVMPAEIPPPVWQDQGRGHRKIVRVARVEQARQRIWPRCRPDVRHRAQQHAERGNHVHSVWRDSTGLRPRPLAEHMAAVLPGTHLLGFEI
jgi:hypothetical protein